MRITDIALLCVAVSVAACAQTPPVPVPPEPAASHPVSTKVGPEPQPAAEPSRDIEVVPLDEDGVFGVRATYLVNAPLQAAREVLIDFDRHAEFRPAMLESEILSREGDSALVRFVVPGLLGINPEVICRNDVTEAPGRFRIGFRRESGSAMIQDIHGSFDIREGPHDGWLTVVQEFFVAALVLDRESITKQQAEDAAAIRSRIEAVHRGE